MNAKNRPIRVFARRYKKQLSVYHTLLHKKLTEIDNNKDLTCKEYNLLTNKAVEYYRSLWIEYCKRTVKNPFIATVDMFDQRIGLKKKFNLWRWLWETLILIK